MPILQALASDLAEKVATDCNIKSRQGTTSLG